MKWLWNIAVELSSRQIVRRMRLTKFERTDGITKGEYMETRRMENLCSHNDPEGWREI